jgi:hypothetical protein
LYAGLLTKDVGLLKVRMNFVGSAVILRPLFRCMISDLTFWCEWVKFNIAPIPLVWPDGTTSRAEWTTWEYEIHFWPCEISNRFHSDGSKIQGNFLPNQDTDPYAFFFIALPRHTDDRFRMLV